MDRAYATFGGFSRSLVVLQLPGAQGFDLIKGFVNWEWEQGGRKEEWSKGGRGGKNKWQQRKRTSEEDEDWWWTNGDAAAGADSDHGVD